MADYRTDIVRASDWARLPVLVAGLKLSTFLIKRTRGGQTRVFDPAAFSWIGQIESRWQAMRREAEAVVGDAGSLPRMREILPGRYTVASAWKTYMLYGYGHKVPRNCALCPETAAAVEAVPNMRTAFFSVLPPRTRLPPHVGIYRGILRYHLGLIIPDPERCGLRIEERVLRWREGQSFVFCDQYEHEAWNDTDQVRVVLFLDFLRPLPTALAALNAWVIRRIGETRFIRESGERLERLHGEADQKRLGVAG
ncbi:MAG TPA: aspartyl/asparaginyl beta-hydroxylase domain-containing protein [Vicinamibacteria bacterium]